MFLVTASVLIITALHAPFYNRKVDIDEKVLNIIGKQPMWHDTNNFPVDSQPMRMNKSRGQFSTHSEKDVSNSYLSCPLTKFLSCSFFLTYVLWYEQPSTKWTDLLCNYQALKEIITCILSFKPPTPPPHSYTHTHTHNPTKLHDTCGISRVNHYQASRSTVQPRLV